MTFGPPLYLASRSPRRLQMLKDAGFDPVVINSGFDDSQLQPKVGASPGQWVESLARLKAEAAEEVLAHQGTAGGTILGADTVCVIAGRIEGQPRDREDARRILHALRYRHHTTITGVAILPLSGRTRLLFHDVAGVRVGHINDDLIEGYLDSGGWQGKAGAYNLSERVAAGWPIVCEGDPATVMGLPMRRLIPVLAVLRNSG